MPKVKAFSVFFTADDILDVEMQVEQGRIREFKVNYRCRIADVWHEAVRYDTEHGALHVHRFYLPLTREARALGRTKPANRDYTSQVQRAEADLATNRKKYRSQMEAKLNG